MNAGRPEVKVLDDGWTAVTRDRSLSAQFEHMIGVNETGCEDLHAVARRLHQAPLHGRLNDLRAQAAGGCARIRMAGAGCGLGYPGASKFARRKKPREESCKMTNRLTRRAALRAGLAAVASPVVLRHARGEAPIKIGMPLRADRPGGGDRRADAPRRRVLGQAAERQGRPARPADRAACRGHRRRSRHLRAQGAARGGARRLPPAVRHGAVVRGARRGAKARRVERDLHLVRQRRRTADRLVVRAELLPREHLRTDGDARRSRSGCARRR